MEAVGTSETSIHVYQTTRCHNLEDHNFGLRRSETRNFTSVFETFPNLVYNFNKLY
jgi:hypothetical protein